MQNEWGYSYLVILPPPLNIFVIFILPSIFRKGLMRSTVEIFSKFIFWFENTFYMVSLLIYFLLLVPYIYFRIIVNIVRYVKFVNALWIMAFWIMIGPIFLLYAVANDMFLFVKTLCDYKDEDD